MRRLATILLLICLSITAAAATAGDDKSRPGADNENSRATAGSRPEATPHETSRPDTSSPAKAASAVPVLSTFPTELTVDGLISLAGGNFAIQMGAYGRMANAEAMRDRIGSMTGLAAEIVEEGGLYKVFINSSLRGEATCLFIPVAFPGEGKPAVRTAAAATANGDSRHIRGREAAESAGNSSSTRSSVIYRPGEGTPHPGMSEENGDETGGRKQNDDHQTGGGMPAAGDTIPAAMILSMDQTVMAATPAADTTAAQEETTPVTGRRRNIFLLRGNNPWLASIDYFGKPVALINALIITIIISFATMLILLLVILLNRRRMEREAELRQYLLEQYQSLIIDYLFGSTGADQFRKIASDEYRRQVLIDQMIDVSVNLKGESREKLTQLYTELELDEDSLARARSPRWHKKVKGFRELAFMGITEGNDEMYRALNSRNEILRMEAQIALVRLSDRDHFEFLSHLKRPFSLWEQITLHDLIVQHELPVPDFQRWLSSENPTVVLFALRMIREFKQTEAEPELRKTLLHRDPRVSRLAMEVAGDLDMRSTLDTMKRMYKYQEYNNCLEIVKSMGKMPDVSMLGFLKLVLDKEDDVQLQIEAVKAIENMGEVGVQALVKIMKSEYKNYNIIVRHVLDRRIY